MLPSSLRGAPTSGAQRSAVLLLFVLVVSVLASCTGPRYPAVTPYAVQVFGADTAGMALRTEFDVHNPNRFGLTVQSVSGTVKLDDRVYIGQTAVNTAAYLPARSSQRVVADMRIPWGALPDVMLLSGGRPAIPYTFEGRARIGGKISIEIPFTLRGQVTTQQLLQATVRGLPGLGVPLPN